MEKTIKQRFCEICKRNRDVCQLKMPVLFLTEQTEGRSVDPYLSEETVDVCLECIPKVIKVHGAGAMGYNEYGLIETKDQFNNFNSERGTYVWKKAKDTI